MFRFRTVMILIVIAVLSAGCKSTPKESPAAAGVEKTQAENTTLNTQATADAVQTVQALSTVDAQATNAAGSTATVAYKQIQDAEATMVARTATQEYRLTSTAEIAQQATAQVKPMADALQSLYDEGVIANMEGDYFQLMDFDQSLAKINYIYPAEPTGFIVDNFVFKAKFSWNTDSDKTNWDRSGCGLIFGFSDPQKYDYFFLGLDGYANLYRPSPTGPQLFPLAKMRYSGKLDIPEGDAEIMLVVVEKKIYFYVNNEKVLNVYDGLYLRGPLAYTLVSGTNKGYGTRCIITDASLWQFSP